MRSYFVHKHNERIEPVRYTAEIYPDVAGWAIEKALRDCARWKERAEGYAEFIIQEGGASERQSVNRKT